jgi:hypothetical protein
LGKIRILLTGCGGIAGRNVIDHFLIGEFCGACAEQSRIKPAGFLCCAGLFAGSGFKHEVQL